MKTEFVDVNETRKNLRVEIPSDVVDAEIDRIARDYSRKARIPGFRPGKVPRARRQAALPGPDPARRRARPDPARRRRSAARAGRRAGRHAGHPRRGVEEGQPLTFTASFDTVPPFDPGDYSTIALQRAVGRGRRRGGGPGAAAAARARARATSRSKAAASTTATRSCVDLERTRRRTATTGHARRTSASSSGATANPPGFDEQLLGLEAGRDQDVHDSLSRPTTRSRSWRAPTSRTR